MQFKNLISKLLKAEPLNPLESAELERFDPDALLAETETLRSECERLRKSECAMLREKKIRNLAEKSGCLDPGYLDYRAERDSIDIDDPAAVQTFLQEFAAENPRCFRARIQPGSGGAEPAKPPKPASNGNDRIGEIISSLDAAPDA